ncbi:hypothetical protein ASZ78_007485 [Callipepla squamata]|uniref:Uncharacterized protein n=1 Tax=Callipepla squamata TaxID=9009 RepID=A0A226MIB1_CALSU|nr:hypothetical protein ASZ78_007485 [Callipepla squamata]
MGGIQAEGETPSCLVVRLIGMDEIQSEKERD